MIQGEYRSGATASWSWTRRQRSGQLLMQAEMENGNIME
jgi:hypothetical protein